MPELRGRELSIIIPASLLMVAIGVAPQWLFNIFNATVVHVARTLA
jgi:NADH:ubiquinone oxidoreductase subunit 4 (subunit M)